MSIILEPSFASRLGAGVVQRAASEPAEPSEPPVETGEQAVSEPAETEEPPEDCSGASSNDYACYQKHYQNLVSDSGVEAAFAELKDEYQKGGLARSNCHQLTHVIGRAAAEHYGDLLNTYGRGDYFCGGGYYHGAVETVTAKIGADRIREEANALCAGLREGQRYSSYHFDCVHGLGHGFMGVFENELFESLKMCDALTDEWERENCYGGVFMENVMAKDNPMHPPKYLREDRPLYPCTDMETRYKAMCYKNHTFPALQEQGGDFAGVFYLCATAEKVSRSPCYRSLGEDASWESAGNVATAKSICMLGAGYEARSGCVEGAVGDLAWRNGDVRAKGFCDSLDAGLRGVCLRAGGYQDPGGNAPKGDAGDMAKVEPKMPGGNALRESVGGMAKAEPTCVPGYEARPGCLTGAGEDFVPYNGDAQAEWWSCESLDAYSRAACLGAGEEQYETQYETFDTWSW